MNTHLTIHKLWLSLLLVVAATSCIKDLSFDPVEPTITHDVIVGGTSALVSASVTYPGNTIVEVEWSESQDFSASHVHALTNIEGSSYSLLLNGLKKSTTYYYRVTLSNSIMSRSSDIGKFTTLDSDTAIVTTSEMDNVGFNTAVGGGVVVYEGGAEVTERGLCWSTGHDATIGGNHVGFGSGTGEFSVKMTSLEPGTKYYVRAYAVNSHGVGYGNEISLTTDEFQEGVLNGVFSIGPSDKIYFSQGNLQYQPSTGTWRLADHQYFLIHVSSDMTVGSGANSYCDVTNEYSPYYSGWVDFFGWGTSGWNNGNLFYQPLDIQNFVDQIRPTYGPTDGNNFRIDLTEDYANSDWGVYNAISNGGNHAGLWRTMLSDEWDWVLNTRNTSTVNGVSDARFVKAKVNNVYGLILFPDYYMHPEAVALPVGINCKDETTGWNGNSYSAADWTKMENEGAVFLPAAGIRRDGANTSMMNGLHSINAECCYWTASSTQQEIFDHSIKARSIECDDDNMEFTELSRACGCSVRLVKNVKQIVQ